MNGTLNGIFRRKEMKRINNGNKKILQQLRDVKPSVGTFQEWKKHENRINLLKKNIMKQSALTNRQKRFETEKIEDHFIKLPALA